MRFNNFKATDENKHLQADPWRSIHCLLWMKFFLISNVKVLEFGLVNSDFFYRSAIYNQLFMFSL